MADDDNFDIDIYGDDAPDFVIEPKEEIIEEPLHKLSALGPAPDHIHGQTQNESETEPRSKNEDEIDFETEGTHQTEAVPDDGILEPKRNPVDVGQSVEHEQEGESTNVKPEHEDDNTEATDVNATTGLKIGEIQWWVTEDDVRGWANQVGVEDDIKEITFNEHKLNGRSKGEVFVELRTVQAASSMKHQIEKHGGDNQPGKKPTVVYGNPTSNPFKTSPKDAPTRNRDTFKDKQPGTYNPVVPQHNFRGRGNFHNNRGNNGGYAHQSRGGFNNNHQMNMAGGYGSMHNMMGMNGMGGGGYGAAQMAYNHGGMMGGRGAFQNHRGGRGGMMIGMGGMNMMPNMAMGGMNNIGMAMGGMNMSMGGFPQGHFNPQFNNGSHSPQSMPHGNPHGTKRQREG